MDGPSCGLLGFVQQSPRALWAVDSPLSRPAALACSPAAGSRPVFPQVLEDACRRQDFNPSEYDLK